MSVIVKGMEMPKNCYLCPFCDYVSGRCDAVKGNPYTPENRYDQRADWCPLVEAPEWISVEERLPVGGDDSGAVCENVCLMMDDGTVSCGWMNGITKKVYYLNARDDFIIKAPITRVTHWMPLPEPPKEDEP